MASAVTVGVHLEHVLGPVRIVLHRGQRLDEPRAAAVDEHPRRHTGLDVSKQAQHFGPAILAIHLRGAQAQAVFGVLHSHRGPVALFAEDIRASHEALQTPEADPVPCEHGFDGGGVALWQPEAFRVFIQDKDVAVTVAAAQQADGVVREPIVERGEPTRNCDSEQQRHRGSTAR